MSPRPNTLHTLSEAIQIVRTLLSEKPRPFQQLLRDGIASHPTSTHEPSRPASEPRLKNFPGRRRPQAMPDGVVPEGHPFISAAFLKKRVLPVLASCNLIQKRAIPVNNISPELFAESSAAARPYSPRFQWFVSDTPSSPELWDRLVSGAHPGMVQEQVARLARDAEEAENAVPKYKPKIHDRKPGKFERDVWAWEDRAEGLTTRLERMHLNKRRQNARPGKERKDVDRRERTFGKRQVVGAQ